MKIYPNPTRGVLRVEFGNTTDDEEIEVIVYDMRGRIVADRRADGESSITIDLTGEANGMYMMMIRIGGRESRWKIVKEG